MEIEIHTKLIDVIINDEPTIGSDNYTKRIVPELDKLIPLIIKEVINAHLEIEKGKAK